MHHKATKKLASGDGMERGALTKMLNMLQYRAEKMKPREKKDEAANALRVYTELADGELRKQFLSDFEANGSGKTPGSLKFALTFGKNLKSEKKVNASMNERYRTRQSHIYMCHNLLVRGFRQYA